MIIIKTKKKKYLWTSFIMISVATIFVLVFSYIPMIQAFILSLKTGKGVNLSFSGLDNYRRMIQDIVFWTTIKNTLIYAVIHIPIMLLLSLLIAVLLNDRALKLRGFYRTCIFLPCVTAPVSYAILFKNIFSVDGILNQFLLRMNIIDNSIAFVLDPFWGKVVIIIALIWRYTGYYMIFYLSALQNINKSVYEAAKMDGCSFSQSFFKITLPLLKPIVFLTTVMSFNSVLQLFDEVVNLTNGGPGDATRTISEYIYDLSFVYVPSYGYAAAISYIVLIIVIVLTKLQKGIVGDSNA
ncbi:MAG: sugar ABC transporter permease [Clostridiales bacterium]